MSRTTVTYDEIGATLAELPPGYRHVRRTAVLGVGEDCYELAVQRLMTWQMHRRAGLGIRASTTTVTPGAVVRAGVGLGRLRIWAPCQVVLIVTEEHRRGFAYGTLPGHPAQGEELFLVAIDERHEVTLHIAAFSRPATWWARLGGPIATRVQEAITDRYLSALRC